MNDVEKTEASHDRRRGVMGSFCLFLGLAILGLLLADGTGGIPVNMPRSWYTDRAVWVGAGLIAFAAGWRLLRDPSRNEPDAHGGNGALSSGARFAQVVLYTRAGCHLCDAARQVLEKYGDCLPPPIEVDIDRVPSLRSRFSNCVPVVEIDGKVRFRGRVNEVLLRRLLAAAPRQASGGLWRFPVRRHRPRAPRSSADGGRGI